MKDWQKEFVLTHKDSLTYKEMSKIISIDESTISKFLRLQGIFKYKLKHLTAEEMEYLLSAFDNGITYSKMAEHLEVKTPALAAFLTSMGLTRNKRKNPGRVRRLQQAKPVSHEEFLRIKKNKDFYKAQVQAVKLRKVFRRRWEEYEDSMLLELHRENVPIEIIAVKLNRSDIAVKARIYNLSLLK